MNEAITIDRERVACIVHELTEMLEVQSHKQFTLQLKTEDGRKVLSILPINSPVEIVLDRR